MPDKSLDSPVGGKIKLPNVFGLFLLEPRGTATFFRATHTILRAHKRLTFDLNKNAYLVLVLHCWLRSHSDYRTLSSSRNV